MAKCLKCGKRGLFLTVNSKGLCADCAKAEKNQTEAKEAVQTIDSVPDPKPITEKKIKAPLNADGTVAVPSSIEGVQVAYTYKNEKIYVPEDITADFTLIDPGDRVRLELEPSNPYDPEAVAAYVGAEKVGYLYKGRIKDMVHDFRRDELPIWAHVSGIDDEERIIYLYVAFYRNPRN